MRTTLTLDDDVARLIDATMHRERRTMKDVVNTALHAGLGATAEAEPYALPVHHCGLRPGFDPARLNQLSNELEDASTLERLRT